MTNSSIAPAPIKQIEAGEEIIKSTCLKCGNEIKLAITGLTKEQVYTAIEKLDLQIGECPGGYHVELCGWRRMWQIDAAVEAYYASR